MRCEANFERFWRQTEVGIVLTQQNSVFGTRSEHSVGLIDTFRNQIVDQHTDVGLVASQHEGLTASEFQVGVDTRHQTLRGGLFVTGRAVDLTREVEVVDQLGFERVVELCGREVVVLDGVTCTVDVYVFQTLNLL